MNDFASTADHWGVAQGYHDVFGHWHALDPQTLAQLVAALSTSKGGPQPPEPFSYPSSVERAYQGDERRVWGIAVQLYAVRSRVNWGHGDFGDLSRLLAVAAGCGAAAVGLNPLHALFPDRAEQASPYAPNSRLFLNPLYIDIEAIAEFPGLEASGLAADVAGLRASDMIAYAGVARAKLTALRLAHARFKAAALPRRADFEAYRDEQGEALLRFACFEALRQHYAPQQWPHWPQPWRKPDRAQLQEFRAAHEGECEFHEFVQWIADRQLQACKNDAQRRGLSVGLYVDLAVGIDPLGADAWSQQDAVLANISIGAPPDAFNSAGQDWGLAPFNPHTLPLDDFAPMRQLMRAAMRHAGAVRLDHVLGLMRLFLIPHGRTAAEGAYVSYPFEALLAVIAEESRRLHCIVIGEDLGTVPENFRETLARWGLWTYRVMMFEREFDGRYRSPGDYPAEALATFNTHDLPTFHGWLLGHDLRIKQTIGIDAGETAEARAGSQEALRAIVAEHAPAHARNGFVAVASVLAATPSRLVVVSLEDILEVIDQINIPGTVEQHPNWRRKLPVAVEDLDTHAGLKRVAQVFAQTGRAGSP
jgi:4-alpha-glucanotransferase